MELINNFLNLFKTLSEKFSLKKSDVSLYLLALIQHTFHLAEAQYEDVRSSDYGSFLIADEVLDRNVFRLIKDSGLIDLKSLSENELGLFTEYVIEEYLKSDNTSLPSPRFISLIANLATESALELDILNNSEPLYDIQLSIYIANVGAGDIIIKMLKNLEGKGIFEVNCGVVGEEPNKTLTFLTKLNCFVHNITAHLLINDGNPLENPFTNFGIGLNEAPQIAISIPPFTSVPQQDLQKLYEFIGSTEKIYFSELAYIELMLKRVSERGKVIAVVRNDFLSSKKSKIFREKYLKNDWIEKIIALPKEFVNYPIDVSVIVFNKTKIEKGFVIFDGSEDKFEKTKISIEEVFSNNADLRVARYASKETEELRNILSHSQNPVKKIKDLIVSSPILGRNYSQNLTTIGNGSNSKVPFIRVSELSKIGESFNLNTSKIGKRIDPQNNGRKINSIDFDAVLVNLIGNKLKPTYFKFEGKPIVIGSDVIALMMKEDINVEYFLTQLHSRLVQIQVEMLNSGTTINRISKEDFLNIQIILPSFEEQQRQILEMRGVIEEKAIARQEVERAEKRTQQTADELIASVAHSFKNKLSPVVMDYAILLDFLREANEKNEPIKFDTLVRPVFEGEKLEEVDTFGKVVNRLEAKLKTLPKVFNDFQILQKGSVNKSIVDLNEYFQEVRKIYTGVNYKIKVINSSKNLLVELDKDAFGSVIDNLITNARDHAFTEEKGNYQIVFELSKTELKESKYARILYKDNGKGFPANFSYEAYRTFGSKSVYSEGSGIGGFIVNKMIELHSGEVNLFLPESHFDEFQSQIEILLPLYD